MKTDKVHPLTPKPENLVTETVDDASDEKNNDAVSGVFSERRFSEVSSLASLQSGRLHYIL